jgi:hypothetical protein
VKTYRHTWALAAALAALALVAPARPSPTRARPFAPGQIGIGRGQRDRDDRDGLFDKFGRELLKKLAKAGPLLPAGAFVMSKFKIEGYVKGDWPAVVEYTLEEGATAEVRFHVEGAKKAFVVRLEPTGETPKQVILRLPSELGGKPRAGSVSFSATKNAGTEPARFFLSGLGLGDKAVGSMVIDRLVFQPGSIRPSQQQRAAYSFRTLSDFDTVNVNFLRVALNRQGVVSAEKVGGQKVGRVRREETVKREWDGKDGKGKVAGGWYQFNVTAQRGLKQGGDWVVAITRDRVRVEP